MCLRKIHLDQILGIIGTLLLLFSWFNSQTVSDCEIRLHRNLNNRNFFEYDVMIAYLSTLRNLVYNKWAYDIETADSNCLDNNQQNNAEYLLEMGYSYLHQRAEASENLIGSFTRDSVLAETYSESLSNLLERIDNGGNLEELRKEIHALEGDIISHYVDILNSYQSRLESSEQWQNIFYIFGIVLLVFALLVKRST